MKYLLENVEKCISKDEKEGGEQADSLAESSLVTAPPQGSTYKQIFQKRVMYLKRDSFLHQTI